MNDEIPRYIDSDSSQVNGFDWMEQFDERQRKEMRFACTYAADYAHGTDGHNRLLIIDKLVGVANDLEMALKTLQAQLNALGQA